MRVERTESGSKQNRDTAKNHPPNLRATIHHPRKHGKSEKWAGGGGGQLSRLTGHRCLPFHSIPLQTVEQQSVFPAESARQFFALGSLARLKDRAPFLPLHYRNESV